MMKTRQIFFLTMIATVVLIAATTTVSAQSSNQTAVTAAAGSADNSAAQQTDESPAASRARPATSADRLTANQKFNFGLHRSLLNPGSYLGPAVSAYFTERNDV